MQKETCPTCHRTIKEPYTESLTPGLCKALIVLYRAARGDCAKGFHLQKNLGFNTNQNNNFNKLKKFGLAVNKSGIWRLTETGRDFAAGTIRHFTKVEVFDGNINEKTKAEYKFISDILKEEKEWLRLEDYRPRKVKQAVEQARLF